MYSRLVVCHGGSRFHLSHSHLDFTSPNSFHFFCLSCLVDSLVFLSHPPSHPFFNIPSFALLVLLYSTLTSLSYEPLLPYQPLLPASLTSLSCKLLLQAFLTSLSYQPVEALTSFGHLISFWQVFSNPYQTYSSLLRMCRFQTGGMT